MTTDPSASNLSRRSPTAMRLYRGIAVWEANALSVVEANRRDGLVIEGRFWSGLNIPDLKPRLESVFS